MIGVGTLQPAVALAIWTMIMWLWMMPRAFRQ